MKSVSRGGSAKGFALLRESSRAKRSLASVYPAGWRRWLSAVIVGLLLAGCEANLAHREGMELLGVGKYSEAVPKLEQASRERPNNIEFRKDYVLARDQAVDRLVAVGNAERAAERFDTANAAYERALQLDPANPRAKAGVELVSMERRQAATVAEAQALFKKGSLESASAMLKTVFLENPNHGKALELQRQIAESEAKRLAATPVLRSNFKKPVTLQFRDANLRMVFEAISKAGGVNILLDKDVRPDLKTSIFVKDVSVEDTIDLILLQNQLDKKVLSDNTIFVYPNLPAKNKEYQDLKMRTFHLVHADAKQMLTLIKTMLKTKDIVISEKTNSLVMRDTPDAIRLAEKIIADQDIAEPEVLLEVELLEVTHSLLRDLGIQYPDQMTLTPSVPGGAPLTLANFFSAWATNNVLVSPIPTVTFKAHLDTGNTNILASPRLLVRTKEKAKLHIGDRLPVFTNSVTPLATGAAVTTGTVQYVDTGIKLEVEPDIHPNGEVALKIGLEVSVAGAPVTNTQSGTTAYPISTRTTSTVMRLKDGETQVMAGLIQDTEVKAKVMVPGLGEIPVLGRLFGNTRTEGRKTEIILSITPRLVGSMNPPNARLVEFFTGTEATLRSEPLVLRATGSVSMSGAGGNPQPPRTGPQPAPKPGTPPAPGAPTGPAAIQPMSFTWQGPVQATVGNKFTVTLNTQSKEAVRNLSLMISYDPAVLKAVDAVEGTFLKQGGAAATFTRDIDQAGGQIAVEAANAGDQGASGSGSLAAITFEVVAAGQSQISVARVAPSGLSGDAVDFTSPAAHNVTLSP
jgi:general secretion pathway protein D